jgi:Domain of unknown function (DUF4386)
MSMCASKWLVSLPAVTYRDQGGKRNMNATIVDTHKSTVEQVSSRVDPSWKGVYRVGGAGLLLAGLIYLANMYIGIYGGIPGAADSVKYLQSLAAHPSLAQVSYGLYSLADFLFIPAALGLYLALKHIAKNPMLLATGLMAVFVVVDLAITEANSLTIVTLTQHAATAASATERAAYMAAANYALATVALATFYSWVVSSIWVLIVSIVMLKGVFGKLIAYLGIVVGIVGTAAGFYVFVPALAIVTLPVLLAFGIWCVLAGLRLYRLGKPQGAGETATMTAA